jgi:hypothetical protein
MTTINTQTLAAEIKRDMLRDTSRSTKHHTNETCFSCGRSLTYCGSRFCSETCRAWFDAGNSPFDPNHAVKINAVDLRDWRVVAGPPGVEIGSNPWRSVIDATERRNRRREGKPRRIAHYHITLDGHGRWRPSTALRALGFRAVDLGLNGPSAWAEAERLNREARAGSGSKMAA